MRIPLIEAVADAFLADAKQHFTDYVVKHLAAHLANQGRTVEDIISRNSFWNLMGPNGESVCTDALGINGNWFYKLKRDFVNLEHNRNDFKIIHKDSETIKEVFVNLNYIARDDDFISYFIPYIKKMDIPFSLREYQISIIRQYEPTVERYQEGVDWDEIAIAANFTTKLAGNSNTTNSSKWHLYFYGYETVGDIPRLNGQWPLVRLRLEFKKIPGQSDLSVRIINTENRKHYNYKGKTDFELSTDKVLVLSLRTSERNPKRQLNIKLLIDGAWGSTFVGQYLNYEAGTDRIFSGDLILEQAKEVNPVPYTFYIDDPIHKTEGYESIKHLAPLLPTLKDSFRESQPIIFDSTNKEWVLLNKTGTNSA